MRAGIMPPGDTSPAGVLRLVQVQELVSVLALGSVLAPALVLRARCKGKTTRG